MKPHIVVTFAAALSASASTFAGDTPAEGAVQSAAASRRADEVVRDVEVVPEGPALAMARPDSTEAAK